MALTTDLPTRLRTGVRATPRPSPDSLSWPWGTPEPPLDLLSHLVTMLASPWVLSTLVNFLSGPGYP